jgi:hypothetical protein
MAFGYLIEANASDGSVTCNLRVHITSRLWLMLSITILHSRCVGAPLLHDSAAAASALYLANAKRTMLPDHAVGLPTQRTGLAI